MRLDLWTIIVVTVFVTALLGALLVYSWNQNRRIEAMAWWGASYLLGAGGSVLLAGRTLIPDTLSIVVANGVVIASYGFLWTGCRRFGGKPQAWAALLAGSAAWFAFSLSPLFPSFFARVLFVSAVTAAYLLLAAAEMWRVRTERLASRVPITVMLVLHALAMGGRPVLLWTFDQTREATLFTLPWISGHAFEALVATVVLAFLFLAISKERVEREQRIMADSDPLTGILNRRAFLERGALRLAAARPDEEAVLLLLDIDHFKRINDGFGHTAGDAVLESFCRLATEMLPPGALFARLGGEEFGCLLADTPLVDGYYAAEYLRNALVFRRLPAGDTSLQVTVSIGLATTATGGRDLPALMKSADSALYRAKWAGRNQVACAAAPRPEPPPALAA